MARWNKIEYKIGEKIGSLIYLGDVESKSQDQRRALFKCECGNIFECFIHSVKYGATKSCGCYQIKQTKRANTSHGMTHDPLFKNWALMKNRCYNLNSKRWKYYGGRGIKVCDEWKHDFKAFYNYMASLPHYREKGRSMDRINNNGNYEPNNMRWADEHTQKANRRKLLKNSTGFTGVIETNGSYTSLISINKNHIWLGIYDTPIEAANVRNLYIMKHGLWEYPIQNTLIA